MRMSILVCIFFHYMKCSVVRYLNEQTNREKSKPHLFPSFYKGGG